MKIDIKDYTKTIKKKTILENINYPLKAEKYMGCTAETAAEKRCFCAQSAD